MLKLQSQEWEFLLKFPLHPATWERVSNVYSLVPLNPTESEFWGVGSSNLF